MKIACLGWTSGRSRFAVTFVVMAIGLIAAGQPGVAKVKVKSDVDKLFDFKQVHTWAWTPEIGRVVVARTASDNPDAIKKLAEPLIVKAVAAELPQRGLTETTTTPDVTVTYDLLLTLGSSAQTAGQFLPAVTEWGVPPFTASTTSLEMIERGSLVLDMMSKGSPVWRGIAEAQIPTDLSQEKRQALIPEAVREIAKLYPPKK